MDGGLDFARQPAILVLVSCDFDGHTLPNPLSTAAIISGTGILLGAGAKFKPLANTLFSATDTGLDDVDHPFVIGALRVYVSEPSIYTSCSLTTLILQPASDILYMCMC